MSTYPQEITAEEADMKFQHLLVQNIGNYLKDGRMSSEPAPVVARILGSTDVLIKLSDQFGRVRYEHWRHGHFESLRGLRLTAWHPLPPPTADARQSISDFDFGVHKKGFAGELIGVPFTYQAA